MQNTFFYQKKFCGNFFLVIGEIYLALVKQKLP
jgi:hypothetical protein